MLPRAWLSYTTLLAAAEQNVLDKLLFGSDFPFGQPRREKEKLLRLGLPQPALQAILGGNWLRLLAQRLA